MISTMNQITNCLIEMRVLKQLSNTITVTSGQLLSRVTVVNIRDVRSHGRNTQRFNTRTVHYIFLFESAHEF